jgi:hypothetical protein
MLVLMLLQAASLLGLGLLHQGSCHRLMTEIMLAGGTLYVCLGCLQAVWWRLQPTSVHSLLFWVPLAVYLFLQAASLLGLGLLHQGSCHRLTTEIMLHYSIALFQWLQAVWQLMQPNPMEPSSEGSENA